MTGFLRIQNEGVASIDLFTRLGLSSSRGDADRIGQFGTGQTMGMLTMLRHCHEPIVFCGTTRIVYECGDVKTAVDTRGKRVSYQPVLYRVSNRKPVDMGVALDHGATEWTDISMALREFVSNAIDNSSNGMEGVVVDIVENPTPRPNKTIVYIELTPHIEEYYRSLSAHFLHFDKTILSNTVMIPKKDRSGARVFRKGVFIVQMGGESLWDWNLGDELQIDESRNLGSSQCEDACSSHLFKDKEALKIMLKSLVRGESTWESQWGEWSMRYVASKNTQIVLDAWKEVNGDALLASPNEYPLVEHASALGYSCITIASSTWYAILAKTGIKTVLSGLQNVDSNGFEYLNPTPAAIKALNRVWDWLTLIDMTNGKEKPPIKVFHSLLPQTECVNGVYLPDENAIALRQDNDSNANTVLHELAHYITGASDADREFERFLCQVATKAFQFAGG